MWRMTPRLATATLTATLALAFAFGTAPKSEAASVQSFSYWTDGSISSQAGVAPIYFDGVTSGTLTTPGVFALGTFDAAATLPPTATLTYNNTPFNINLFVANGVGANNVTNYYDYAVSGVLNGSITGVGTSSMVATVTSITGDPGTPPFPASQLQVAPQGINAPNTPTFTDGITTLFGQANVPDVTPPIIGLPAPAPEPSTIAVFGLALAGWACQRRLRSRAKRARA
jgi:PEP-CTERM motif